MFVAAARLLCHTYSQQFEIIIICGIAPYRISYVLKFPVLTGSFLPAVIFLLCTDGISGRFSFFL